MDKKCKYYPMEVTRESAKSYGFSENDLVFKKIGARTALCILIPVTEDEYKELMRPIWREEKEIQRKMQRQSTGEKIITSLEYLRDEFELEPVSTYDVEKEVLLNDLKKAIDIALETLEDLDKKIIKMFMDDKTEKEIATEVGMSQKGVNKRKQKIFKNLKIILKDFSS